MSTLTIRNLDEDVKAKLRVAAAREGHSMEEHVRQVLARSLEAPVTQRPFGSWMHSFFADIDDVGLDLPDRTEFADPIDLAR